MKFTSGALFFSAVVLLSACEPSQAVTLGTESRAVAEAIVGGVTESSHWYVVMVGDSQGGSCTGTLLSRRTVITAGHCRGGASSLSRVYFDTGNPLTRTSVLTTSSARHPQYNGAQENDLSLVQLAADAPIQAVPLLRETMTQTPDFIGPKYTFVGFGDINGNGQGFGTRRVVTFPIDLIGPAPVVHAGQIPQGSPITIDSSEWYYQQAGKNTCFGDSGGPAFIVRNGVERHAGATSYGDQSCTYDGVQAKTDATTVTWIQQTIDLWEGAADPCKSDGVCGTGCVLTTPAPLGALKDPDCADQHCGADGVCVLSCAVADPDCASLTINDCADNGICNTNCSTPDADCVATNNPLGTSCGSGIQCASGFCANGVCCDSACNGGCQACSAAGACSVKPAASVCRSAAGACDVAETCDGTSPTCPVDGLALAATVCRAKNGACDVEETCSGAAATCPADALSAATTACRPSAGPCDVAEVCTGTSAACPGDVLKAPGVFCRINTGLCDVAEACDGATAGCPADAFSPPGITCRPANGTCDVAEACAGTSGDCPPDLSATSAVVCRSAASECDVAETCTGSSKVCPADVAAPAGTVCSIGACSASVCVKPRVVEPVDAGMKVDAGVPVVDAGTTPPEPPRGCGCSTGGGLFFALGLLPLLVRRRRQR